MISFSNADFFSERFYFSPQHSIMRKFKCTANLKYFYSEHPYICYLDFATNGWLCYALIQLIFLKYKCGFWPIEFAQNDIHLLGLL